MQTRNAPLSNFPSSLSAGPWRQGIRRISGSRKALLKKQHTEHSASSHTWNPDERLFGKRDKPRQSDENAQMQSAILSLADLYMSPKFKFLKPLSNLARSLFERFRPDRFIKIDFPLDLPRAKLLANSTFWESLFSRKSELQILLSGHRVFGISTVDWTVANCVGLN